MHPVMRGTAARATATSTSHTRVAAAITRTKPLNHPSRQIQLSSTTTIVPTLGWLQQQQPLHPLGFTAISQSHRQSFHTTAIRSFAVRRRRGAKRIEETAETDCNDDDENDNNNKTGATSRSSSNNPLQHTPVRDTLQFRQAASDLFNKLERALTPMKAKNDPFVMSRLQGDVGEIFQLDLGPKEGLYQLEISEEECVFEYSSPISGKILYCLSATSGEWVGVHDGNAFEGIFVRDLIRQCQGLPKL